MQNNHFKVFLGNLIKNLVLTFALLSFTNAFTQTGPAGVGNSSSNVLWLRADQGVYKDAGINTAGNNDSVTRWQDMSGNGIHANQTIATKRPHYYTNIINGLPAIKWTASKGSFLESAGVTTANNASIWVVGSFSSLASPNPGILQGRPSLVANPAAPGDKSIGMWVDQSTAKIWGRGIQSNGTSRDIALGTVISSNTFFIANNIYRSNKIDQYVNSAFSNNTTSFDGTLKSWANITIGMQANECWNGNIAEVIVFNKELNETERIIVDNYLAAKYALPLSTNSLYVQGLPLNGKFAYEVAGIGRVSASDFHDDAQGTSFVRINNPQDLNNDEFLIWGHNNDDLLSSNLYSMPTSVKERIGRTWRVNEVNTSGSAVDVGAIDIIWDLSNHPGPIDPNDLVLMIDNDGDFSNATTITGATSLGGRKYKFSGVTAISNNSYFTLGTLNFKLTPLPIELLSFSAKKINLHEGLVQWTTVEEVNNDHFTLYKSTNGVEWFELTQIQSEGNSHSQVQYEFLDNNLQQGVTYYKLTQTDRDGTEKQVGIIMLDNSITYQDIRLYPNQVENELTIELPESSTDFLVMITDATGKTSNLVADFTNNSILKADMSSYKPGIYFVRVANNQFSYSFKIIKSE